MTYPPRTRPHHPVPLPSPNPFRDDPDFLPNGQNVFSRAELRIARHLADGLSNKEIAAATGLAPLTIKSHLSNMLRRLGVDNRGKLIAWLNRRAPIGVSVRDKSAMRVLCNAAAGGSDHPAAVHCRPPMLRSA